MLRPSQLYMSVLFSDGRTRNLEGHLVIPGISILRGSAPCSGFGSLHYSKIKLRHVPQHSPLLDLICNYLQ